MSFTGDNYDAEATGNALKISHWGQRYFGEEVVFHVLSACLIQDNYPSAFPPNWYDGIHLILFSNLKDMFLSRLVIFNSVVKKDAS